MEFHILDGKNGLDKLNFKTFFLFSFHAYEFSIEISMPLS
ncbi:hypothetical protein C900_04379 [Fulvivirga imtechensis AK7]|uniref:Uncharacterized protein n=1 Tax=Fulvivirga imtechensis AK7 TaxID=1237149 RepID=L8JR88_9BACT|nr:hypothetical protein C900_04379 [Fulvivirga imtechensis AK7]